MTATFEEMSMPVAEADVYAAGPAGLAAGKTAAELWLEGEPDVSAEMADGVASGQNAAILKPEAGTHSSLEPGTPSEIFCFSAWDANPTLPISSKPGLVGVLESWLRSPMALTCCNSSGFVAIHNAISLCAELKQASGGHLHTVEEAVSSCVDEGAIILSPEGRAVQLRCFFEKVQEEIRAENQTLPPGWCSDWDHSQKRFIYFPCDIGGACLGPPTWDKPPCFPQSGSSGITSQLAPQEALALPEPAKSPAHVALKGLSFQFAQDHPDEAALQTANRGLSLEDSVPSELKVLPDDLECVDDPEGVAAFASSAPGIELGSEGQERKKLLEDSERTIAKHVLELERMVSDEQEDEFPNDSDYKLGQYLTCDESFDAASVQDDTEDPLLANDPWQAEASSGAREQAVVHDPWQVEASTTTQDHALRWAQWLESMNSNMDIPDAWGRKQGSELSDLYVAGMHDLASEEFLHALFGTIQITTIRIPRDTTGAPKGYAFVVLADKSQADEAIRRLHGKAIGPNGRVLVVRRPHNPSGPKGRKGMDGKNVGAKGKSGSYQGMNFGFQGESHGVKGRDAIFKGKGRSYAGKGLGQESLGSMMTNSGEMFGTDANAAVNAEFHPPLMQAMPEPSMVAVCGSSVTLQQGWFQDSTGGMLPCSFWAPSDSPSEVAARDWVPPDSWARPPEFGMDTIQEASEYMQDNAGTRPPAPRDAADLPDPEPEPEQPEDQVMLREALEKFLGTPRAAASFNSDGFLPIQLIIESCQEVKNLSRGRPEAVVAAIHAGQLDGLLALSDDRTSVRPRALLERARLAAEMYVAQEPTGNISLLDLLTSLPVDSILKVIPETTERLQTLKDALFESPLVQVCGSRVVWQQFFYPGSASTTDFYLPQMHFNACSPPRLVNAGEPRFASEAAPARRAGKGAVEEVQGREASKGPRPDGFDRRAFVCKAVAALLRTPEVQEIAKLDADGWVQITRLFEFSPDFSNKMFRNPSVVVKGIIGERTQTDLALHEENHLVRLLSPSERLASIAEQYLLEKTPPAELQLHMQPVEVPLDDIMQHPPIEEVFQQSHMSSRWRTPRSMLRQALEHSDTLDIRVDEMLGNWVVAMRPIDEVLLRDLESFLESDAKAKSLLQHEGEVPLSWIASDRRMQRTFTRIKTQDVKDVELQALRSAVEKSSLYELDDVGVSIRCVDQSRSFEPGSVEDHWSKAYGYKRRQSGQVKEKDAIFLRKLLMHYFDPFNLQHNRILMAVIHEHRKRGSQRGYLRGAGHRPAFSLQDLSKLPRISRLLESYDEAGGWLLAAALKSDLKLPVRMCQQRDPRAPRGAWATPDPKIELTYMPNFRFVEVVRNCPEVQELYAPSPNPLRPLQHMTASAFNVVSFSVSSDLSHHQSPKSLDVIGEITAGGLDPATMTWESRLPRIKRQLLQYGPDIICVQGVQSIGFAERCSQLDPAWFHSDNEPTSNHLVYLYRELDKDNYGVTFSPTLKLPGSAVVCFGNAIFWKRSRWQMEHRWAIQRSAICAILSSKLSSTQLVICSSKSPAAYIRDWGDSVDDSDLIEPMRTVQQGLLEAVTTGNVRPVWCGDFACEPRVLLPGLSVPSITHVWQSASMAVSDGDPVWTSVSKYTTGGEVDLVLHDDKLEVLAGLGGLAQPNTLVDLLKSGYSSDHLLQMVAFREMHESNRWFSDRRENNSLARRKHMDGQEVSWATPSPNFNLPQDSRWRVPMGKSSRADCEPALPPISPPPGLPRKTIAFQ